MNELKTIEKCSEDTGYTYIRYLKLPAAMAAHRRIFLFTASIMLATLWVLMLTLNHLIAGAEGLESPDWGFWCALLVVGVAAMVVAWYWIGLHFKRLKTLGLQWWWAFVLLFDPTDVVLMILLFLERDRHATAID